MRQVLVLQQTHADATRQLAAADAQAIDSAAELRAVRADLQFRLQQLVQAEQDLAAAEARAKQIEAQLVPLRALEATLQQQEAQRAAAQHLGMGQAFPDGIDVGFGTGGGGAGGSAGGRRHDGSWSDSAHHSPEGHESATNSADRKLNGGPA
ncbi:MAG: hypothetical protein K8J09_05310 [Planctomycetes bacterium]|nr:hypothetical protein [Planctomycetota bacterium]